MKIVIDSAIPFINGVFEPFAEVAYLSGEAINADAIEDADALIIRTRTICNEELLKGSKVRHIATATIGYDHIDLEFCAANNIDVITAAGCNARAVLQWISAALVNICSTDVLPKTKTIGIVGVGNVGRLIEKYATLWGFNVICCDPPRAKREQQTELGNNFIPLETLLKQADIITFHTPLNATTHHLLNSKKIKLLKDSATIINTSRGEVIETQALLDFAQKNSNAKLYIDVWESEPKIDAKLCARATVATPHIAGYTLQGKANGTAIAVNEIAKRVKIPIFEWYPNIDNVENCENKEIEWSKLQKTITQHFDIERESATLKENTDRFEVLRNNYAYRNEYF